MNLVIDKKLILKRNDKLLEDFLVLDKENEYMKNYYRKEVEQICKIRDGYFLIDKPRIKTSFCFGSGWNGVSSLEEDEVANDLAYQAKNDEDYFLEENLQDLNKRIKVLEDSLASDADYDKAVLIKNGCNQYSIVARRHAEYWNEEYVVSTEEEVKEILKLYISVKENFKKRLSTYLKKYGLTKINSWTYLRD